MDNFNTHDLKIFCPFCKNTFPFNAIEIPDGAIYEIKCPNCEAFLKHKKVTENIDLGERAKIKQQIVRETGYKTAYKQNI